ncbi:hypothetical protein CVT25_007853 [Psilocybe cyanescens]|uniref:Uncharacterized protein n=1 Tax=Psilocybe cyanescens TaxID=93625 RepID=A0A409XT59_PSICY|nr:hypothetical protein CVT25_007853 [Psilocybe cyanescens]
MRGWEVTTDAAADGGNDLGEDAASNGNRMEEEEEGQSDEEEDDEEESEEEGEETGEMMDQVQEATGNTNDADQQSMAVTAGHHMNVVNSQFGTHSDTSDCMRPHTSSSPTPTPPPSGSKSPIDSLLRAPLPQRGRSANASAQSKQINKLLRPMAHNATRAELIELNLALQAELSVQELGLIKLQQSQKSSKRKAVKFDHDYLTGAESLSLRKVQTAQHEEKEKKKAASKKKQTAKNLEAVAKRAAIYNNPTHIFSGSLKSQSKNDLITIATILELDTNGTKDVLSERIETYFRYHPEEKVSERFCGLFNSTRRGARRDQTANLPDGTENIPPTYPNLSHPLPIASQAVAGPSRSQPQTHPNEYRHQPYQVHVAHLPAPHYPVPDIPHHLANPLHSRLPAHLTDPCYNQYHISHSTYTQPQFQLMPLSNVNDNQFSQYNSSQL